MSRELPTKVCASCGRRFEWRKRWRKNWESVRYCSRDCAGRRVSKVDRKLEQQILELLGRRRASASICPSEVARLDGGETWRERMEPVRRAARRLCANDTLEITQGGRAVDPTDARGPIRLRLKR